MNKYIAIYVRRSVSDKEKGNNSLSIPAQIADCIKFVGEDAFYKVYEEDGKSGKDIKHRPAFRQMFEDCREGLVGTSKNPLKIRSKCSAGIEIATFATTLSKHR